MLEIITNVLALVLLLFNSFGACEVARADDPMNKPLDSLRVFDYDRGLCNDRWNTCGDYERTSFGFKYPGRIISELGTYPEAEVWSDPVRSDSAGVVVSTEDPFWERRLSSHEDWATQEYRKIFQGH